MVIYISFARYTSLYEQKEYLGVAQFGSVLEWGSRGRRFESSHPDHFPKPKGFGISFKMAATLDTPPPMLYNGVVAGSAPP